ncbi:unnamed protein product [Camellia sinensis]
MGSNSKSVVDFIEGSSGFIFLGFHLDGLELRNSEVEQSAPKHAHKQPFVIGEFRHIIEDLFFFFFFF